IIIIMKSYFDNIIYLDIKTSSLSPKDGEILEIACIKFANQKISSFHRLIKNENPIKKTILDSLPNVNAIDFAKSAVLKNVLDEFNLFISDFKIITHNATFKREFLELAFFKSNMIFKNKLLDSLELISLLEPFHNEYTLKAFTKDILNEPFINRAQENVIYTIKIINKILERTNIGDFTSQYIQLLTDWSFTPYLESYHLAEELLKIKTEPPKIIVESKNVPTIKFKKNCEDTLKDIDGFKKISPTYKFRQAQYDVMANVRNSLDMGNISIIEAPTGTGKSIAYLLPSIIKAYKTGQKIFISTNTKELQRQLTKKDIPFLLDAFDLNHKVDFVNIKGKGNYLCPEVLDDVLKDAISDTNKSTIEKLAIVYLDRYSKSGEYGDFEEINFFVREHFKLDNIIHFCSSDSDGCNIKSCHKQCFYKNTVEKLKDSTIVVLNHSLLLRWSYDDEIKNVIIDEAHNLSNSIFDAYASGLNSKELRRLLLEILDYEKRKGYINYVWRFAQNRLANFRETLRDKIKVAFNTLERISYISTKNLSLDYDLDTTFNSDFPNFNDVQHELLVLKEDLLDIYKDLKKFMDGNNLENSNAKNRAEVLMKKIERLQEYISFIEIYTLEHAKSNCYGLYCSKNRTIFEAYIKDLNSPLIFFEKFLNNTHSCVFLSATLKNKGTYENFKKSLAIEKVENRYINEVLNISNSFDLATRTIVASPSNSPRYYDENFIKFMVKTTLDILEKIPGNLLILFTSKKRLETFKEKISLFLSSNNIKLYQSKRDLEKLQDTSQRSVLLGSKGFFEGIDIPGDALSCVLMDKLPIINPSDPLYAKLMRNGKSFTAINSPKVLTDFKQCFGRLIRTELDYGYFIVFDKGKDFSLWNELSFEYKNINFTSEPSNKLISGMSRKFITWNILNMDILIKSSISNLEKFLNEQKVELQGNSLKLINSLNIFYKTELRKKKLNQNIIFKTENKKLLAIYAPLNFEVQLNNKKMIIETINILFS
ncbi:MAG: helicase C-terminal domain-containing protein, partial [Sarcina sp.]